MASLDNISEKKFETIFEYAPDAIYISDLRGNFINGNKAAEILTGYKRQELIGKSFLKLKLLAPNEIIRAAKLLALNLLGQPTGPDQFTLTSNDGKKRLIEIRTFPIETAGNKQIMGIARDITERKKAEQEIRESEEKYSALFEASADGILIADIASKKFKNANPAICKMFGYTAEEFNKLSVTDIHPKEKLAYVISEFEAQSKGLKTLAENIPCLKKDGSIFYADINSSAVTINNNSLNVGFFRDITGRKKAEEEINRKNEDLEKFNKLAVDRELKMMELKDEILKLKK
ncbi:MAG: PAS domain S-box protein [Candidatus Parcubacteria bacterium]|nr:PAS domain S-box protein [Candidatus Parcubacteria bacterium]